MALKNNQAADHVAYLVRFVNAYLPNADNNGYNQWIATHNSAFVWIFFNDGLAANPGVPDAERWQSTLWILGRFCSDHFEWSECMRFRV